MLGMLLAYNDEGEIFATLDYLVAYDSDGRGVGLVDFSAHEESGGEMLDVWSVEGAKGSKVWPEWIGSRAHDFRVELVGPPGNKRIGALVHKVSGYRRQRETLESEISARVSAAGDEPADIRDLVGGPDRPLVLDDGGRTLGRSNGPSGTPSGLPVVGREPRERR